MAILSIPSSALSFCSKSKLAHHTKPSLKSFPTLGRKGLSSPIMNEALPSTSVEGVLRRTCNHHPKLWDDDFIQSLPKLPYDAPQYREHAETLVGEIKDMFNVVGATNSSAENVVNRLEMVDNVERLGIRRHFQTEIGESLDYVYRYI